MNPFFWSGPAFLLFYIAFGFLLLLTLHFWNKQDAKRVPQDLNLLAKDPYRIAYLRGGASEAVKIATISLIDRRFLLTASQKAQISSLDALKMVDAPLEKAVLKNYISLQPVRYLALPNLLKVCNAYHEELLKLGYLLTQEELIRRIKRALLVICCLLTATIAKLGIAFAHGRHNVSLLLVLTAAATVAAIWISYSRRSAAGDMQLRDLRVFFNRLKVRVANIGSGSDGTEAILMAAVFGAEYLPYSRFPFVSQLYPRSGSGGSGGSGGSSDSGCSSSCSSGGDSGGSSGGSNCSSSSCGGGSSCGGCGGGGD